MQRPLAVVAALALAAACTTAEPVADTDVPLTVETSTTTAAPSTTVQPDGPEAPSTAPDARVRTLDVLYNADVERQILDVNLPTGEGPFPVVLAIHGGRFRFNSKAFYAEYAEHFPSRGIAFVPINYRFAPDFTYPAQVEDAQCALAWVHAHADAYGFDPTRVVVLGGSSGGYLAAMLATVDDRELYHRDCPHDLPDEPIAGAVLFYGLYDFNTLDDYPPAQAGILRAFWGAPYEELTPGQRSEMSPISWIDGSEPPMLVIHGSQDMTIPPVMSERFVAALNGAGVPAELVVVESGHGFENYPLSLPEQVESIAAIERFVAELP